MKIPEIIAVIEKHIKTYREEKEMMMCSGGYIHSMLSLIDAAIDALTDLRNEFAMELKNEN